jgi:pyruvate ferredoxin oxidoreductase alpha subunit
MVANGQLQSQFINVESEHSAASVVLGAVATGVRAYTATSSQGLLLMSEVIFNIAGMRLPVILTCANRAVSAPINIWNDQQDSMAVRDSGWIQFYAENHQDLVDLHIQAYRLAEDARVMLPVMVCMDGYILTHGLETVDIPAQEEVNRFLPDYRPLYKLDIAEPISMGCLADPDYYMETRFAIQATHQKVLSLIPELAEEFKVCFGRACDGLLQTYRTEGATDVLVAMGSVCGTIKETVDDLRNEGRKIGLLKLITYRPFPYQAIFNALKGAQRIAVLDKAISLGAAGPLYTDVKVAFQGKSHSPRISGFVIGLGGRDIDKDSIRYICQKLSQEETVAEFVDLKPELLKQEYE